MSKEAFIGVIIAWALTLLLDELAYKYYIAKQGSEQPSYLGMMAHSAMLRNG